MRAIAMRGTSGLGVRLLGVWLVLHGLLSVTTFAVPGLPLVLAVLALASGLLILAGR